MQVFELRWKTCFISNENPVVFYLVFHYVSKFIHLTQMVVIYWLLTAWVINEFKNCLFKIRLGQSIQWHGMKQVLTDTSPFSSTKQSFKGHDDHIIEVFVPLREQYGLFNFLDNPCFCSFLMYQL